MAAFLFKWWIVSVGLMMSGFVQSPHPFYISVTEINHNAKEQTLEISVKMFADDIEQTLEKNYKATFDIGAEKDKPQINKLLPDYIGHHLSLAVDGKPATLHFIGFEKDKESVYAYFEVSGITSVKHLDVTNSILHDFNTSQINIIHATVNGRRQSTKLDYPEVKAGFGF